MSTGIKEQPAEQPIESASALDGTRFAELRRTDPPAPLTSPTDASRSDMASLVLLSALEG